VSKCYHGCCPQWRNVVASIDITFAMGRLAARSHACIRIAMKPNFLSQCMHTFSESPSGNEVRTSVAREQKERDNNVRSPNRSKTGRGGE
jgi:hypothetical protein